MVENYGPGYDASWDFRERTEDELAGLDAGGENKESSHSPTTSMQDHGLDDGDFFELAGLEVGAQNLHQA